MSDDNRVVRSINELSLATWFGGSLMGAVGVRRAAAMGGDAAQAERAGWEAWQPIQVVAIGAQLLSGAGLTVANRGRYLAQRGVPRTSLIRTAITGGAIVATAMAASRGHQLADASAADTDPTELDRLRRQTRRWQAVVPLLTGALVVSDAVMGEQQRTRQVVRGLAQRLVPGV